MRPFSKNAKFAFMLTAVLITSILAASSGGYMPQFLSPEIIGVSSAGTLTITQLREDFGTYVSNNTKEIYKLLQQPTVSEKYMTTIASTVTEYRAASAVISDVVQGFTSTFNDKGNVEFTPITITNRRHKINVLLKPDDIYDSWVGFLVDNDLKPADRPLIKYVVDELLLPKVNENRELKLIGKGVYDVDNLDVTGSSMDGFVTILQNKKAAGTSKMNFISLEAITKDNVVEQVEVFVDEIDELYQSQKMPIFCDPQIYKMYKRNYRDLYGGNTNFSDGNDNIDYSNNMLVPLPSMQGTGAMFTTPKANFVRLINRSEGASNMYTQEFDYGIKIFADWWEAVGFAIEEAVFAYIPETGSGAGI